MPNVETKIALSVAQATPVELGRRSAPLMQHGLMSLRYYKIPNPDPQTPHDQDELYFVTQGSGMFVRENARENVRVAFGVGDILFVKAQENHRFEDCTPKTEVWVVFYGPKGGESGEQA